MIRTQVFGSRHMFPCGCVGILPGFGEANKFAVSYGRVFWCRVSRMVLSSRGSADKGGYSPVDCNIPHSVIRKLMDEPNCERCGEPLKWKFGIGKTPHLHHNHETGEIYGFTHPVCNQSATDTEIERLKKLLRENNIIF